MDQQRWFHWFRWFKQASSESGAHQHHRHSLASCRESSLRTDVCTADFMTAPSFCPPSSPRPWRILVVQFFDPSRALLNPADFSHLAFVLLLSPSIKTKIISLSSPHLCPVFFWGEFYTAEVNIRESLFRLFLRLTCWPVPFCPTWSCQASTVQDACSCSICLCLLLS